VVDEPWLAGAEPSEDDPAWITSDPATAAYPRDDYSAGRLERLEVTQCIDAYAVPFQSA